MSSSANDELSIEDVEFLQAVRHIEENPGEYDSVVAADGRATTEALNRVLQEEWDTIGDWSRSMISYRLNKPEKSEGSREWGVDGGGLGLVELHAAELDPHKGWTSRSVELTEKGLKRLSQRERQLEISRTDEGSAEELDTSMTDLEIRVSDLESELEAVKSENEELREMVSGIASDVTTFKESTTGALDSDAGEQLEEVFNRMVRQSRLNQMVFGVDTSPFSPPGEPSKEDIEKTRTQLRETLLAESDEE